MDTQTFRAGLGRILDRFGQLSLPLGVGLAAGYWFSDLGVSWKPEMLAILSVFFLLALLLIFCGQWLKGRIVRRTEGASVVRKRTVALLVLALLAAGFRLLVSWAEQPTPLTSLEHDELRLSFELDTRQYEELDQELERLVGRVEASELFRRNAPRRALTGPQERLLRDSWAAVYTSAFVLDQIRIFYEDWYRFDVSRAERHLLVRSYLLTYAAELALYEKSLRFTRLVVTSPEAAKFLDGPHPGHGLPENSFSVFRQELLGLRDQARVVAGEHYLRFLEESLKARRMAEERGFDALWDDIESHLESLRRVSSLDRATQTVRGDLQVLKRTVRRTWFPAQKGIAEWIGAIKTRRIGRYLITREQLVRASEHLEPGDILLGRKNWYLTNVALPGFWPHAMLYVGEPEDFLRLDTPEVRRYLAELAGEDLTLSQYMERTFPLAWARYREGADGEAIEVLEAVGEGVVLRPLAHAAGDYLAALRPRLGPLAKAQAVIEAFRHLGKPYDFDFDFATDHALVCSEVVWRSYRPAPGKAGMELPLFEVAGRLTLPPNEIARLYAEESGRPDRRLDFVYFLDAREREQRVLVATEEDFRESHARLKWDVFLD